VAFKVKVREDWDTLDKRASKKVNLGRSTWGRCSSKIAKVLVLKIEAS
jgi:hypothetical protein